MATKKLSQYAERVRYATRRKEKVMDAVYYRNRTGLCPVCRTRPANRLTCGDDACMNKWLPGGNTPHEDEDTHETEAG